MYREERLKELIAGQRILIAGEGREGQSVLRLVQRLLPDVPCTVAARVERHRWRPADGDWRTDWPFDLVVKSPGIPTFYFPDGACRITSLTDLFLQVYGDMTIGVTGTKGKSTTASLIHHLLPGSLLAGNIGIPLFDILDDLHEGSLVVAELSCHQLEVLHRSPHVAVLLNLFQEHLDHYEDYMGYKMAKMQIALHQSEGDHFFYCADNDELRLLVESKRTEMKGVVHPYSLNEATEEERDLLGACPLTGDHNSSNALVACRVASLITRKPPSALFGLLSSFRGLRHRLEPLGRHRGIDWYDDSISTIPAATMAAVKALPRVDTLILGGFDRGIDYMPLVDFLVGHPIGNIVFVGAAGRRILTLAGDRLKTRVLVEDDYTRLVPWCAAVTPQGGTVLLSPAAASYDAFKNFEHRGDFFAEQINKL